MVKSYWKSRNQSFASSQLLLSEGDTREKGEEMNNFYARWWFCFHITEFQKTGRISWNNNNSLKINWVHWSTIPKVSRSLTNQKLNNTLIYKFLIFKLKKWFMLLSEWLSIVIYLLNKADYKKETTRLFQFLMLHHCDIL